MKDLENTVMEWLMDGYCCSQIMILAGLAFTERDDRDLVAAMSGLCKGAYSRIGTCGALTGGCCLLGFYAGKGSQWEETDPKLIIMIEELRGWFRENWGHKGDGITCGDLLKSESGTEMRKCLPMIVQTLGKAIQLLEEHGFDVREGPPL